MCWSQGSAAYIKVLILKRAVGGRDEEEALFSAFLAVPSTVEIKTRTQQTLPNCKGKERFSSEEIRICV